MSTRTFAWYVWHPYSALINSTSVRDQLAAIITKYGITDMLVCITDYYPIGSHESEWVSFMTWASGVGVNVWGEMSGNYPTQSYATIQTNHEGLVSNVLQFNHAYPTIPFYGFAADIEDTAQDYYIRYQWAASTYYPGIKAVSYSGDTIASTGMKLLWYDDALITAGAHTGVYVTQTEWTNLAGSVDIMELQCYGVDTIGKQESGVSRRVVAEAGGYDWSTVMETHRYSTYSSTDHYWGWQNDADLETQFDTVEANNHGYAHYQGICIHDDTGLAMRNLVLSKAVVGTTLTLKILRVLGYSGTPAEEITISSPGMTSQTFTPDSSVVYTRVFTDYVPGQNVTITATRTSGGAGPCSVMVFDPTAAPPPDDNPNVGKIWLIYNVPGIGQAKVALT